MLLLAIPLVGAAALTVQRNDALVLDEGAFAASKNVNCWTLHADPCWFLLLFEVSRDAECAATSSYDVTI